MAKAEGAAHNCGQRTAAYEVTALVHGKEEADKAPGGRPRAVRRRFRQRQQPSTTVGEDIFAQDAVSVHRPAGADQAGTIPRRGRRLIEQGGIAVDDVKVTSLTESVKKAAFDKGYVVLKKGKKAFHKVILG